MYLNELMHPDAVRLTALLFQMGDQPAEERAYDVLENEVMHLSDDAKGDLYSLIAEQPLAEVGQTRATTLVSRCLWMNQYRYPRG